MAKILLKDNARTFILILVCKMVKLPKNFFSRIIS